MTYLISDIHGDFRSFLRMLDQIEFSDEDRMYVLGDIFDRGRENLQILEFICRMDNIILIKGNHELFAQSYLKGELSGDLWDEWGGEHTRYEIDYLSEREQADLLKYLEELPYYIQLKVQGEIWTLSHSGICEKYAVKNENGVIETVPSIKKAISQNEFKYLVSQDIHEFSPLTKFDTFLVVGHVPTIFLTGRARIMYRENYMDIDAGNGYRREGGRLACYCMETDEEFYI